jgi:hypothetical protein
VCATVEGVASCGIRGEQVAEAGLEQDGVCPKAEFYFERGGVCVRGLACTLIVLYVPSKVGRRRAGTVVACVITVGESLMELRSCSSCTPAALCRVDMRIECCCHRRASAESCSRFVSLTRGGLGRDGDRRSKERRTRPKRGFSQEHTMSKARARQSLW